MRHRVAGRKLNRTSAHRQALRRNLAASLFEHETISTTIEKAKEVKPFAEKLITLARKGTLAHRRRAIALLGNRNIVTLEDGEPVRKGTVIGKLFSELGPRFLDRPGGYSRIIRLSLRRLGDNGEQVLLQLVGEDEKRGKNPKPKRKSQKPVKGAQGKGKKKTPSKEEGAESPGTEETVPTPVETAESATPENTAQGKKGKAEKSSSEASASDNQTQD